MLGAVIGDIAGSRFEFDRGPWTKKYEFFTPDCQWTDDTVMTMAVAEALMAAKSGINSSAEADDSYLDALYDAIYSNCIISMKKWGKKYPYAGYGGRFISWVLTDEPEPYGSYGNGSAMRVSPAGWLFDTMEETRLAARATAAVSHNHPEGIKGAECTAAVIFMGRKGASREEIRDYVESEFGYDMSMTVDYLRLHHRHDESCMDTLPKALVCFMEGTSYEDTVRNATSIGGDTDTIAAIAGAMAEAFFGIPENIRAGAMPYLEADMVKVYERFCKSL